MIFKLIHGGVKENLVLTTILREWRRRHPQDAILLETSRPEIFIGNADVTAVGSWKEDAAVIDFDILEVPSFDMHIMDIYAFAAFGDNRLLSRRMVTGYPIAPCHGVQLLMGMRFVEEHSGIVFAIHEKYDAFILEYAPAEIEDALARLSSSAVYVGCDEDATWLAMATDIPIVMLTGPYQPKNVRPFREGLPFESVAGKCEFMRDCIKKSSSMFGNVYYPNCRNSKKQACEVGITSDDVLAAIDRIVKKEVSS